MSCCTSRVVSSSLAAFVCFMVVVGCGSGPKRLNPTKVNAASAATKAMTAYDANKDGKISGDEFEKCPSLKQIAKNGEVTGDMIATRIREWQMSRTGRVSVSVQLMHNGKPLNGANIKMVPEKFLSDLVPATGTTTNMGIASMSVPTTAAGEPKGASLGFYRVEVTKEGVDIPAKYNTESTLGFAVVQEDAEEPNVVAFNLVY